MNHPDILKTASIHDLFRQVKEHPDFRFGTIFVAADIEDGGYGWNQEDPKWREQHLTRAGFDYLDEVAGTLS